MKRLAILIGILGMTGLLYAATITQPMPSPISVLTAAQVVASTPTYVGQVIVCSACTAGTTISPYSLCISTETTTAANGYVMVSSAATVATCK